VAEKLQLAIRKFVTQHIQPLYKGQLPISLDAQMANLGNDVQMLLLHDLQDSVSEIADDKTIRQAAEYLRHLVISQLDKNNGCLLVQCKHQWHRAFAATLVDNPAYQRINATAAGGT
jgi:hypothetical protein